MGCVIRERGAGDTHEKTLWEYGEYIGHTTNNQAEYQALVRVLEQAVFMKFQDIVCHLDSELVVKQLNGQYRVKDQQLAPLYLRAYNLSQKFHSISFRHIPRGLNKQADRMVNEALDRVQQQRN